MKLALLLLCATLTACSMQPPARFKDSGFEDGSRIQEAKDKGFGKWF